MPIYELLLHNDRPMHMNLFLNDFVLLLADQKASGGEIMQTADRLVTRATRVSPGSRDH